MYKKILIKVFSLVLLVIISITLNITNVIGKENSLELTSDAKSAILIEASTGEIIYEKNSKDARTPASLTKIMTMILVMEAIENGVLDYDTKLVASERAKSMGGTTIFLETGEEMTVDDLLKGVAITSANDAAVCLAEGISGSVEEFVKKMNEKALRLGCVNTHFSNCNGLPIDNHYSCAYDMAIMGGYLVNAYPDILKYTSIYEDYLRKGTDKEFWLVNTNKLVRFYDNVDGLKTGWTQDAGYCLVGTQMIDGIRFVAVVMGGTSAGIRNKEIMTMLNYGTNTYELKEIIKEGELIDINNNILYKPNSYKLVASDDLNIIMKKGEKLGQVDQTIEIYDEIIDDKVGIIKIKYDNKIYEIDLVSDTKVKKANIFDIMIVLIEKIFL